MDAFTWAIRKGNFKLVKEIWKDEIPSDESLFVEQWLLPPIDYLISLVQSLDNKLSEMHSIQMEPYAIDLSICSDLKKTVEDPLKSIIKEASRFYRKGAMVHEFQSFEIQVPEYTSSSHFDSTGKLVDHRATPKSYSPQQQFARTQIDETRDMLCRVRIALAQPESE